MNNGLKNIIIFSGGAVTGAAAMYFIAKNLFIKKLNETINKYEDLLDNFVEYQEQPEEFVVEKLDEEHAKAIAERKELNKPDVSAYAKTLKDAGYKKDLEKEKPELTDYTAFAKKEEKASEKKEKEESDVNKKEETINPIRVITEEYFDELSQDDFDFISYTYFSDHILADENEEKMDDEEIDKTITLETLRWIDTHKEEDSIYVVNEILNTAYEIVRDLRTYEDVAKERGGW